MSAVDLPPAGGFPQTIRYQRSLPRRGPSGAFLFGAATAISVYGWYTMSQVIKEKRGLAHEKAWSRLALVPLLQAETDRDLTRRALATEARETEIMANVPGWGASDPLKQPVPGLGPRGLRDPSLATPVYYTSRHVGPTIVVLDDSIAKDSPRGRI